MLFKLIAYMLIGLALIQKLILVLCNMRGGPCGVLATIQVRKLEFLIAFLVSVMAACFFVEFGYAKPEASEVFKGLFVPQLKGDGATGLAISLLGAMVMLHNLFLHSALVLSRKVPHSVSGIKEACRFYTIESGFALFIAFLINVAVISISGAVCSSKNLNPKDQMNCQDLDLNKASFLLKMIEGTPPFPLKGSKRLLS